MSTGPLNIAGPTTPYDSYVILLSQSGTDTPVPTVYQNTLNGRPVWSRVGVGIYFALLAGAFPGARTWLMATMNTIPGRFYALQPFDDPNQLILITQDAAGAPADIEGLISIEVRVYATDNT